MSTTIAEYKNVNAKFPVVVEAPPPVPPAPAGCQPNTFSVSSCPEGAVTIPEEVTVTFSGLSGALAVYNDIPIVLTHTPGWNAGFDRDLYNLSFDDCYWAADLGGGAHQAFFVSDGWYNLGTPTWYVQINDWHLGGFSANAEYLLDEFPNNGPGYDPCDPRGSITYYSGAQGVGSTCILSF